MLKFTTRNNNTNAATTREIYPRIIRGISIDSPRMAIGHEPARLSRTKHEPPRRPKWMIYRVRRENDTKWRGQSVLPSFSRDCFSPPLSPPSPFFLLSLIVSKKEKNVPNVAYVKRLAYFRLFVEGSTILDHVTTPSLLIIGMTNKNVGPIIHWTLNRRWSVSRGGNLGRFDHW